MKVHEILTESKTQKAEVPKPRNFVAKNAINTGAGAHKDKKKAAKQGDAKHKKQAMAMESYPRHQDLSGVSTDKLKAYLAKQGQQQNPGEGNQVKRVRAELQRRSQSVSEGSAHGYNVVRWYRKNRNSSKITAWLKKEAGLPKETKLYFDDADLVLGSDTIVPEALVDDTLKFNDLLTALVQATGGTPKQNVDGVYRSQGVAEGRVDEKAKSKAQQKFMGMVYAAKKGEKPASPEVAKVAKGMSKKSAKDYAQTKHKGKPEHVKETATAGATSAANVSVGAVYKNKKPKMQKPGTNALDMKGGNLMTGGSIKR